MNNNLFIKNNLLKNKQILFIIKVFNLFINSMIKNF